MSNLTANQSKQLSALTLAVLGIINTGGNERPWKGTKILRNPSMKINDPKDPDAITKGLQIGTTETANINLIVPQELFVKVEKALPLLNGTGEYLTGNFYGQELVCIDAYIGKVSGEPELQFTQRNAPRVNPHGTDEAKARFDSVFNKELITMKVDRTTGEVHESKTTATEKELF